MCVNKINTHLMFALEELNNIIFNLKQRAILSIEKKHKKNPEPQSD